MPARRAGLEHRSSGGRRDDRGRPVGKQPGAARRWQARRLRQHRRPGPEPGQPDADGAPERAHQPARRLRGARQARGHEPVRLDQGPHGAVHAPRPRTPGRAGARGTVGRQHRYRPRCDGQRAGHAHRDCGAGRHPRREESAAALPRRGVDRGRGRVVPPVPDRGRTRRRQEHGRERGLQRQVRQPEPV